MKPYDPIYPTATQSKHTLGEGFIRREAIHNYSASPHDVDLHISAAQ